MRGDRRCIDGRWMEHRPQRDDPDLEVDVGSCPDCDGEGCHPNSYQRAERAYRRYIDHRIDDLDPPALKRVLLRFIAEEIDAAVKQAEEKGE